MSDMNFDQLVESQETAPARRGLTLELRKRPEYRVAGLPTVSLLPRELKAAARDRTVRRAMVAGVVVALVVAGGVTAGATALAGAATARLDAANAQSRSLSTQVAKFKDVQLLQQGIALGNAAKTVGTSTEIDWQSQIDAIEQNMPSSYSVQSITADSASPIVAYPQGTTPLEQPRSATVTMTVSAPTITALPIWLRELRGMAAYADATTTVGSDETSGYTVLVTVHLSPAAILGKATK